MQKHQFYLPPQTVNISTGKHNNSRFSIKISVFIKQPSDLVHSYTSGQTEVAELLIKSDADIGAPDNAGWTPYCKAQLIGN